MIALAHASEILLGLRPCELCLTQREVYWASAAASVGLAALVRLRPRAGGAALLALALFFFAEAAVAAYHAGVEWRWWPGPARCTGGGAHVVTAADMQALLSGKPEKIVQCDVAAIRILGLSMAGWNTLVALALAIASLFAARRWSRAL
jgi:disulfide bond formation protein DsbB